MYKVGLRNKKLIIAPFMCAMQCLLNKMLALKKKSLLHVEMWTCKKEGGSQPQKKNTWKKMGLF